MEDVKNTLKPLKWTESVRSINKEDSVFPLIAKPTPNTASLYEISEDPVLLHHLWYTRRLIVQNLEDEGAYVVGPLLDIPAEYSGTFQYLPNQKGYAEVYSSVKEIAQSLPERVFLQENLLVYPICDQEVAQDKVKSVLLPASTQLSVLEKMNVTTIMPSSKFAFGVKSRLKTVLVSCVAFRNETTKEILNIPLTTRGRFSTMMNVPRHGRELDFRDVVNELDLPINLITCANCPQTSLDEHCLRSGMRLRATAIEEHEVIIGVTTGQTIVEFAAEGVDFVLPHHLDGIEGREQEIAYQTSLQRFLMECQIKNSPVNVRDYKKSIRIHVARNIRLTKPKAVSQVASSRPRMVPGSSDISPAGVSAIQLLSFSGNGMMSRDHFRRSSAPRLSGQQRLHRLPLPTSCESQGEVPPLPPRNSLRLRNTSPIRRPARAASYHSGDNFDFPPAPLPPNSHSPKPLMRNPRSPNYGKVWDGEANAAFDTSTPSSPFMDEELAATAPHKDTSGTLLDCKDRNLGCQEVEPVLQTLCEVTSPYTKDENIELEASDDRSMQKIDGCSGSPLLTSPASMMVAMDLQSDYANPDIPPISDHSLADIIYDDKEQESAAEGSSVAVQTPDSRAGKGSVASVDDSKDVVDAISVSSEELGGGSFKDLVSLQMSKRASDSSSSSELKRSQRISATGGLHTCPSLAANDGSSSPLSLMWNYASSPQGWKPPADLSDMSVKEVADSLRYIGMTEDTVEWFRAEKVDGRLLCGVEKEMLAQHFRLTAFQQRKIAMFVQGWRPKI